MQNLKRYLRDHSLMMSDFRGGRGGLKSLKKSDVYKVKIGHYGG